MKVVWAIFFLFILTGCQSTAQDNELSGRITLWHSWEPAEALILDETLALFQEIHPGVQVFPVAIPEEQILNEFIKDGENGLGSDILIGNNNWIGELVEAGLIRPNPPSMESPALSSQRTRSLVQYRGQEYGIPLFLGPQALYYNQSIVEDPPETLDELLTEARNGNQVAMVPRFEDAYWGIQSFGDGLFDERGHFTLAESGFTEWLHWLNEAQNSPGVIMNVDDESLLNLFSTAQVAYFVSSLDKQALILSRIDEENPFEIGVVPLPGRPNENSGPLLPAETILLYAYTSPKQTHVANALAEFLVNEQQSIRFLRELDRVPANPDVRVDRRIYPIESEFARQAISAVVIPNETLTDPFLDAGNQAIVSVLSGIATPEEAACIFGREVASFQGYSIGDMDLPEGCEPSIIDT